MLTEMRLHCAQNDRAEICLTVPAAKAVQVMDAIRSVLALAGHKVHRMNAEGERVYSVAEVFPDASPAMALQGLRGKEDLTQAELAARLGISQNRISDMESGKRPISVNMAKKIGKEFGIAYQVFV